MSDLFKALADPTRRAILDELQQRNGQTLFELCVRMVTNHGLTSTRQAISQHLDVLEAAGLVRPRRQGRYKFHDLRHVTPRRDRCAVAEPRSEGVATMRIVVTSVMVDDQAKAHRFYTDVLGFMTKHDIPLGKARWLTVVSPQDPNGRRRLIQIAQSTGPGDLVS